MPEDPGSELLLDAWERSLADGSVSGRGRWALGIPGWVNEVREHRDHSGTWCWPGAHAIEFVCADCDARLVLPRETIAASGWVSTSTREWLDWARSGMGWEWLRVTADREGQIDINAWRSVRAPLTEGHTRLCVVQGDWIASLRQHADHVGLISAFFSERLVVSPGAAGEIHPHVGFRCRQCGTDDRLSMSALEATYSIWFANEQFAHLLPAILLFGAGVLTETFTLQPTERAYIEEWYRQRVREVERTPPGPMTLTPTEINERRAIMYGIDPAVPEATVTVHTTANAAPGVDPAEIISTLLAGLRSARPLPPLITEPTADAWGSLGTTRVANVAMQAGPQPVPPPSPAWARLADRAKALKG